MPLQENPKLKETTDFALSPEDEQDESVLDIG